MLSKKCPHCNADKQPNSNRWLCGTYLETRKVSSWHNESGVETILHTGKTCIINQLYNAKNKIKILEEANANWMRLYNNLLKTSKQEQQEDKQDG